MILLIPVFMSLVGCSTPHGRPPDESPPVDCQRRYESCLKGKQKNIYTQKFCDNEYLKCDEDNY